MKILLCEASPTVALDLCWLLYEQWHLVCGIVRDTGKCLDKVEQTRPDLVILDADLRHGLTGHDLIEALARSGVPSLILSGDPPTMTSAPWARTVLKSPLRKPVLLRPWHRPNEGFISAVCGPSCSP